jgi:polyhydroxybutyrate depolymerase
MVDRLRCLKAIRFAVLLGSLFVAGCLSSGGGSSSSGSSTQPNEAPGDSASVIPSEGCGQTAPSGTQFNVVVNGTTRSYLVVLPSGYNSSTTYDLVFGFHGNTFTSSSFASTQLSTSMRSSASNQAIFIYPQGLDVTGLPMEAAGGQTGTGWDWRPSGRDIQFFDVLYGEARSRYCFDRSRVFSFGRSHGGFFNTTLACVRGNLLRAAAETAGGYSTALNGVSCNSASLPYWKQHNSSDPTVAYSFGLQTRDFWVAENSCASATVPVSGRPDCVQYQTCEAGGAVVFCSTSASNHDSPSYVGGDIWSFFQAF